MKAVIGMGFGDEGKGRVVDYICSKVDDPRVIRYSGGHQAAHHVITEDKDHVFHNFGSGTFQNAPTMWSRFCTVEPMGLMREYKDLKYYGIEPTLYIDRRCPVTTPYDIQANFEREAKLRHGSCTAGFGNTIQREEDFYHLRFGDLFNETVFKIKMDQISRYYYYSQNVSNEFIENFLKACKEITDEKLCSIAPIEFFKHSEGWDRPYWDNIIFEGSQGLLLDQHFGFFPNVSRSNIGSKNIMKLLGADVPLDYFLVTRAYQTRHGNGPMTNEDIAHNIKENPYELNFESAGMGKFKRSILDLDLLKYSIYGCDSMIRNSENKTLVITCLDLVKDEYKFTEKGKLITCSNENVFIERICKSLNIKNVLLSRDAVGLMETRKIN